MVVGTSEGFAKDLQLIGVGYRGAVAGSKLTMNLGFSHPVEMEIPHDVEVKVRSLVESACLVQSHLLLQPAIYSGGPLRVTASRHSAWRCSYSSPVDAPATLFLQCHFGHVQRFWGESL